MKKIITGVFQGMLVGVANIIPGVSGGTVALVLGIYERLIRALRNIDMRLVKSSLGLLTFKKGASREFGADLKRIDAAFLCCIGGGAVLAIVLTAGLMEYLLENHHAASYAFFFGLVLVSILVPYRYLKRRSWKEMVSFLMAGFLIVSLTCMVSDEERIEKESQKQMVSQESAEQVSEAVHGRALRPGMLSHPGWKRLLFLFLAAALAISAMVLPGISGSFVLLLLGVYFDVLLAINDRQIIVLAVFALGCFAGLLVFSRIMNILLERLYDITMAFMIGLMAGSLWALWPFKRVEQVGDTTLYLGNLLPETFGFAEITAIGAFVAGGIIVMGFYVWDCGKAKICY